jgi:hypothetical protein
VLQGLAFAEMDTSIQPVMPARSKSAINVPLIVAISFSSLPLIANAPASQTEIVRPGFTTLPLNMNRLPLL